MNSQLSIADSFAVAMVKPVMAEPHHIAGVTKRKYLAATIKKDFGRPDDALDDLVNELRIIALKKQWVAGGKMDRLDMRCAANADIC